MHNISAILLTLLHNDNVSRVHLANTIGVSSTTITNLVSELAANGYVIDTGLVREGQVGRPQRTIQLVPDARFAIGIHIDVGHVYIALSNLIGDLVDREHFEHERSAPASDVLKSIVEHVHTLLDRHKPYKQHIIGVGVAASGLIDVQQGINVFAPNLNWHHVSIKAYIERHLPYPVMVENNVRAMAVGEAMFGAGRDVNSLAFVYGRIGVGAGFVLNGDLYRGAGSGAGEIGHTMFMFNDDKEVYPLEDLVSEPVILNMAEKLTNRRLAFQDVVDRALDGDHQLKQLLEERAHFAGIGIVNMVNILNPELIILGGIFQQAKAIMLPQIIETVHQYAFANLADSVRIHVTQLGRDSGMMGAAAVALDTFFYRPQLTSREAVS